MASIMVLGTAKELGLDVRPSAVKVAGFGGGATVEGETSSDDCRFGGPTAPTWVSS